MDTVLVAREFGGQSIVSADIQNWIGMPSVSGFDLAQSFEKHVRSHEGVRILTGDGIASLADAGDFFRATTEKGEVIEARFVFLATGSIRRKLGVPGEKELDGKGVVYCSTCDAPLFSGKPVAVIGGGNAGLEAGVDLLPYATHITFIVRGDTVRGDAVSEERLRQSGKVDFIFSSQVKQILGDAFVTGLIYTDPDGREQTLAVDGVFVEIGALPNSFLVQELVTLNARGEVVVDHKTQRTSHPRIWAAGDVTDVLYKQNNISAGDAVKATLNIYETIVKA
jgi:alkyl hydroperoxide reductase subunit F